MLNSFPICILYNSFLLWIYYCLLIIINLIFMILILFSCVPAWCFNLILITLSNLSFGRRYFVFELFFFKKNVFDQVFVLWLNHNLIFWFYRTNYIKPSVFCSIPMYFIFTLVVRILGSRLEVIVYFVPKNILHNIYNILDSFDQCDK